MAQRVTAIMAGVAAAACVAAGVLLYQLLQTSRAAQAATLAEMRDFNSRLLAQLAARPAEESTAAANWASVRVKLVSATDDTPIVGQQILLSGSPFDAGTVTPVQEQGQSNAEGDVELNSVPFGRYSLSVWTLDDRLSTTKTVLVGPDRDKPIIMRVPASPGMVTPHFEIGAPPSATGLAFLVEVRSRPLDVDGLQWQWIGSSQQFLVDDARVTRVTQRSDLRQRTSGFENERYELAVDPKLPAIPMYVFDVDVVQIREHGRNGDGEHVDVLKLASYQLTSREAATAASDAEDTFRVTLPDRLWQSIERGEVRLGLKPVPPGMQLTRVASNSYPSGNEFQPGMWAEIILNYQSSDARSATTVRLLDQVEIFDVHSNDAVLSSDGSPQQWNYTLYLTDEQAELVELAQRTRGADFVLRTSRSPTETSEAVAVDPQLRDRLKQAASSDASPPNGSGA